MHQIRFECIDLFETPPTPSHCNRSYKPETKTPPSVEVIGLPLKSRFNGHRTQSRRARFLWTQFVFFEAGAGMPQEILINPSQQLALFDELTKLVSHVVNAHSRSEPHVTSELNGALAGGAVLTLTFTVGGAGALDFALRATRPDGHTDDVFVIEAPPARMPFRFVERGGA